MHMMWPERRGHLYDGAASAGWRAIRPDNCNKESQHTDFTIFHSLCIANIRNLKNMSEIMILHSKFLRK
jgi:hypothetical protein